MSARVILSVKVLHMGMCAVYPVCMLNGLCQIPQLSFWESTEAEHNCQYRPGKLERWGRFCYWYFFSAWPFYNLSTQTSPSCLIWLNWPEQWRLENYCCGFKSQWKKLSRNNPLFYIKIMLKDQTTSFRLFFLSNISIPLLLRCCTAVKWPSLVTGFSFFPFPELLLGDSWNDFPMC